MEKENTNITKDTAKNTTKTGEKRFSRENKDRKKLLEEKVISIGRVTKVTKGGRHFRFSATVVVGNRKGLVGIGTGKANEVPAAIAKASMMANKNVTKVAIMDGRTIPHEATGKVVGNALINEGCDILFVAAGGSGNGVFTAAKEASNVKVIGCDVDQYDDGTNGDSNVVLTSVLKVMDKNVEKQLNAVIDGTFGGKNDLLGADTDSTGYVKEEGRQQLSAETITKLDEVYELVKSGTVVPASNFNGILPEDLGK